MKTKNKTSRLKPCDSSGRSCAKPHVASNHLLSSIFHLLPLLGLALLTALAVGLWTLDFGLWTCGALALASAPLVLTEEQIQEFQGILGEMKGGWAELKTLPTTAKWLHEENVQLKQQMTDV